MKASIHTEAFSKDFGRNSSDESISYNISKMPSAETKPSSKLEYSLYKAEIDFIFPTKSSLRPSNLSFSLSIERAKSDKSSNHLLIKKTRAASPLE